MRKLLILSSVLMAGCQTLSVPVTVNLPSGAVTGDVSPLEIYVSLTNCNNKEVVIPTDMLRNANLQAPMQGGTTQGDQVQGK
jgi:hypothetical protein